MSEAETVVHEATGKVQKFMLRQMATFRACSKSQPQRQLTASRNHHNERRDYEHDTCYCPDGLAG